MSYCYDFSVYITVIKYRPQKIVLPACPGDLPACPPKRKKVKGKCAGVPSIYILQPAIANGLSSHTAYLSIEGSSVKAILSLLCGIFVISFKNGGLAAKADIRASLQTIGSVRSGYPIEGAAALGFRYAFFAVHRA